MYAIMLPPELEEFPTKEELNGYRKGNWKRVARKGGRFQCDMKPKFERPKYRCGRDMMGQRKQKGWRQKDYDRYVLYGWSFETINEKKAKEMLSIIDEEPYNFTEEPVVTDYRTEREKRFKEILFQLRAVKLKQETTQTLEEWEVYEYIMDTLREEGTELLAELEFCK